MPNLRLLTLALGLSMLVTGCGVRHPEQVESLAEAAAEDPRKTGKLVAALRSKHEEVRVAAQEALVELGSSAAPELRDVVLRRKPEAGPALLVLGLMGDPDHFPLLEQHLGDPTLGPWARDGLEQGSVALWNRIAAEPDMALCDAYLQWFPEGAHSEAARDLRRELEAEAALAALGPDPRYGALVSYHRRYGDTRAGEAARLAGAAERDAHQHAVARDRPCATSRRRGSGTARSTPTRSKPPPASPGPRAWPSYSGGTRPSSSSPWRPSWAAATRPCSAITTTPVPSSASLLAIPWGA